MAAITLTGRFAATFDLSVLMPGVYMAGALLVGAAIIAVVRRIWRSEEPARIDAGDQLAHFRSLYEKGQLSEEEFKRLRKVLGGEMRKSLDLPPAQGQAAAQDAARPEGEVPPPPGPSTDGIRPA